MDEWVQAWRGLRAGEPRAYEFLLERLGRGVWAYLRRMSGSDELADELFGRTWLRLVQSAGCIRSPQAIRQYVLSIARRQWLDELDRRRRDVLANPGDQADADGVCESTSALEALAKQEDVSRLRGAIDRLPEPLREVVVLRTYVDLTFSQIAEMLGLPLGTVLTRMRMATGRIASQIGKDD
jgi:RNA polymerase sigma-70 factor (ECF subfamily)